MRTRVLLEQGNMSLCRPPQGKFPWWIPRQTGEIPPSIGGTCPGRWEIIPRTGDVGPGDCQGIISRTFETLPRWAARDFLPFAGGFSLLPRIGRQAILSGLTGSYCFLRGIFAWLAGDYGACWTQQSSTDCTSRWAEFRESVGFVLSSSIRYMNRGIQLYRGRYSRECILGKMIPFCLRAMISAQLTATQVDSDAEDIRTKD